MASASFFRSRKAWILFVCLAPLLVGGAGGITFAQDPLEESEESRRDEAGKSWDEAMFEQLQRRIETELRSTVGDPGEIEASNLEKLRKVPAAVVLEKSPTLPEFGTESSSKDSGSGDAATSTPVGGIQQEFGRYLPGGAVPDLGAAVLFGNDWGGRLANDEFLYTLGVGAAAIGVGHDLSQDRFGLGYSKDLLDAIGVKGSRFSLDGKVQMANMGFKLNPDFSGELGSGWKFDRSSDLRLYGGLTDLDEQGNPRFASGAKGTWNGYRLGSEYFWRRRPRAEEKSEGALVTPSSGDTNPNAYAPLQGMSGELVAGQARWAGEMSVGQLSQKLGGGDAWSAEVRLKDEWSLGRKKASLEGAFAGGSVPGKEWSGRVKLEGATPIYDRYILGGGRVCR
jgi:hypothetical protein